MKKSKQILALSLAACLTLSPLTVKANKDKVEIGLVNKVVESEVEEIVQEYVKYEGKIVRLNKGEKSNSIFVKDNEEEEYNGHIYHLNEGVIIIDAKTKEMVSEEVLEEGMKITAISHKFTPVAQSLPPQSTPNVIIINEGDDTGTINVSKFDENLINVENTLKIIIEEDKTIIVDENGETVEKEDLKNRDLIVFYSVSTRSIPAQAPAHKIILMNERKEEVVEEVEEIEEEDKQAKIQALDKIIINEKEISLEKELYSSDGFIMIPLRQIAEELGYEVSWNNTTRTAELTKGAQWTSVTIGQDNYSFAKMLIKLGIAPEIKNSNTFVPYTFLEEVLKVNLEVTEAGIIKIVQ